VDRQRKHRLSYLHIVLASVLAGVWLFLLAPVPASAQGWNVGDTVNLNNGTCIRVGPGTSYHAHTKVPVDNWAVKVTGGPRIADGKRWFDTSRAAAGDPSGGTGWVEEDQQDSNCPDADNLRLSPGGVVPTPTPITGTDIVAQIGVWWAQIRVWWDEQSDVVKWGIVILALLLLLGSSRQGSSSLSGLVKAVLLGLILWWLADHFRASWSANWRTIAPNGPDLALVLGLIPPIAWLLTRVVGRSR